MARLYNTRVLLDPTMIQNVSNVADKRLQNEMELNKRMGDSIRSVLSKGGETLDEYRARKQREELINDWDIPPELRNDPAFKVYESRWINDNDANGLGNYLNSIANRKLQENTMKWHSDVQDRERISTWERGRQQAENKLSYINALLEKDPKSRPLLYDKENTISDANYYRNKLGMKSIEEDNENKPQPQTTQGNENKNLGLSNEEFSKIFNEKINTTVWTDKNKNELIEMIEKNITDPAIKLEYMTKITNKGVTKEEAENFIAENLYYGEPKEIPEEYKATAEKYFNDKKAKLENTLKTLNRRNKADVDAYNAELTKLQAQIDKANMTDKVKLPAIAKFNPIPTLEKAREGYKKGIYTAKQMREWGLKYNDEIGDWE